MTSREFLSEGAWQAKLKSPLEMVLSAVRVLDADVTDPMPLAQRIADLGQPLYGKAEPTGYSTTSDAWANSAGFTTMDTKVLEGPTVSVDGSTDLAYTPDKAFTAWSTYDFGNGLVLGGGARYNGELKRGNDGAVGTPEHTDDYWVFDAVATYEVSDELELRLNL